MGFYDMSKYKKVNVKVEYDRIPIRHMAVQCPDCKNWIGTMNIRSMGQFANVRFAKIALAYLTIVILKKAESFQSFMTSARSK